MPNPTPEQVVVAMAQACEDACNAGYSLPQDVEILAGAKRRSDERVARMYLTLAPVAALMRAAEAVRDYHLMPANEFDAKYPHWATLDEGDVLMLQLDQALAALHAIAKESPHAKQ